MKKLQADAENRPMYLESSSDKNTAYYRKFGFEAKGEILFGEAEEIGPDNEGDNKEVGSASGPVLGRSSSFSSDGSSDEDDATVYPDPSRMMQKQQSNKPPVRLILMVREPQPPLFSGKAKSIPIKLGAGFKGL
jgi:hypothetical protein